MPSQFSYTVLSDDKSKNKELFLKRLGMRGVGDEDIKGPELIDQTLNDEEKAEVETRTELFNRIAADFSCDLGKVSISLFITNYLTSRLSDFILTLFVVYSKRAGERETSADSRTFSSPTER